MSKSPVSRLLKQVVAVPAFAAGIVWSCAVASPAMAWDTTLCPSSAVVGGINETANDVAGPLDGSCGANSAVTLSINHSTDYAKLTFYDGTPGYPPGLTLAGLSGLSASVAFSGGGGTQPFYELAFTDGSDSLGQANAADQILMIEFQPSTLSGGTMAADPNATLFNLYDNTTNTYLQGGQSDTNSIAGWLTDFASLGGDPLQEIRIGMGLAGSDSGPMTLTVNSLDTSVVPEPASLTLIGVALVGLGVLRRKRARGVAA